MRCVAQSITADEGARLYGGQNGEEGGRGRPQNGRFVIDIL